MWHYITASSHAYASIQTHSQSYNNIMLNSQYHSHFDKMEAVFAPNTQQEYSLIPYCKTNPLLSVSQLLLCHRYNVFCVEIIYKKRNHTKEKATSHSKHLHTFCNIPFSNTLAFSVSNL